MEQINSFTKLVWTYFVVVYPKFTYIVTDIYHNLYFYLLQVYFSGQRLLELTLREAKKNYKFISKFDFTAMLISTGPRSTQGTQEEATGWK